MKVKITIELREDGKVYVTGPLHDKKLCLDIIQEAKQAVYDYNKTNIVIPGINDIKKLIK